MEIEADRIHIDQVEIYKATWTSMHVHGSGKICLKLAHEILEITQNKNLWLYMSFCETADMWLPHKVNDGFSQQRGCQSCDLFVPCGWRGVLFAEDMIT